MSQIYYLELTRAALPLDRLARKLHAVAQGAGLLPEDVGAETFLERVVVLESGLVVDVCTPLRPGPDQFTVDFGMNRAARVIFQVDGLRDFRPQLESLLVATAGVLDRVRGDAVLHYEYGVVWLVRRRERLCLSDDDDLWRPERLALIRRPFDRETLVFSDVEPVRPS